MRLRRPMVREKHCHREYSVEKVYPAVKGTLVCHRHVPSQPAGLLHLAWSLFNDNWLSLTDRLLSR